MKVQAEGIFPTKNINQKEEKSQMKIRTLMANQWISVT